MNVLVVCKYFPQFKLGVSPFNEPMINALRELGVDVEIYPVKKEGFFGYLYHVIGLNLFLLKNRKFDLIHAIYGLSGVVAHFQPFKPVLVTFIGSDINIKFNRRWSKFLLINPKKPAIYVSQNLLDLIKKPTKGIIIPFGIDFIRFLPLDKSASRQKLQLDRNKKFILFGSRFDRPEKNSNLAIESVALLNDSSVELIELRGIKEEDLTILYNAVDLVLLTSLHEGSPTIIKEAMACNCPIVTTDVGDVRFVIGNTHGCYITSYDPKEVAEKISAALNFSKSTGKTKGRERLIELGLDSDTIAKRIIEVYKQVIRKL